MDAVRIKQDFLEDIRRAARAQLSPETPNGFAAVVLGLVANAIRERDRERKQSFADVTAARMALRDLLDNPHSVAARDEARQALAADLTETARHAAPQPTPDETPQRARE